METRIYLISRKKITRAGEIRFNSYVEFPEPKDTIIKVYETKESILENLNELLEFRNSFPFIDIEEYEDRIPGNIFKSLVEEYKIEDLQEVRTIKKSEIQKLRNVGPKSVDDFCKLIEKLHIFLKTK